MRKCDGQTPSCSKCAKAGVRCIDTDTYRAGVSVPRAFVADAHARLEWLEDLVRTRLPYIDLDAGPPVSGNSDDAASYQPEQSRGTATSIADNNLASAPSTKRPLDQASGDHGPSVSKRARRMAANLGLFSLNPNAMQAQYLGSSSGSFFADLLVDPNSEHMSDPDTDGFEDVVQDSRSIRHNVKELLASLRTILPTREDCDSMVKRFFSFYHADYPVLHQPSIFNLVDALYASADVPIDCQLQYNGWPASIKAFRYNDEMVYVAGQREGIAVHIETGVAHLFFVLSIAAELQTRKRRFAVDPKPFSTQAMTSLQRSVAEVSLSSTQSMVLYVLHSFLSADGAGIWVILHIAMSYAIDIGLQRDRSQAGRHSPTVLQMRRRIFLTIYTLERYVQPFEYIVSHAKQHTRYISTIQGRPLGFEDHVLDLTMPVLVTGPLDEEPVRLDQLFLTCSIAHFEWAVILSETKQRFYRLLPGDGTQASIQEMQDQLQAQLERWLDKSLATVGSLPSSHRERLATKFKIDYHFALGLVYQPSRSCPRPDDRALGLCFNSAKQRIRLFDSLYCQNSLTLSWPMTHGALLAGATYIYSIWASTTIRSSVSPAEVAGDLRLVSSLLALGGEWYPLAQRGKKSFEQLSDSTLNALLSRSAGPSDQFPTPLDSSGISMSDNQWLDVETMLQPYFQNDLYFPDMLGTFDLTAFDPSVLLFDDSSGGNVNTCLSG